jgi:hypothetical protein
MRFWSAAWLVVMVFGVGGFAVLSALIAIKGLAEVKAILDKLKRESRDNRPDSGS